MPRATELARLSVLRMGGPKYVTASGTQGAEGEVAVYLWDRGNIHLLTTSSGINIPNRQLLIDCQKYNNI